MIFQREFAEWTDFWWEKAGNDTCRRILLIGDSITRSYRNRVQEIYKPEGIAVDKLCGSRCAGDPILKAELDLATGPLCGYRYDVIHFNNGLHGGCNDTDIPLSVYAGGIEEIVRTLQKNQPQAKLILAASTPMREKASGKERAFVRERNALLKEFAEKNALAFNDLYALTENAADFPQTDGIHFEAGAAETLGTRVAEYIREFLR